MTPTLKFYPSAPLDGIKNDLLGTEIGKEVIMLTVSITRKTDLNFDVLHGATGSRYANGKDTIVIKLGPTALFGKYEFTPSSKKYLEVNRHAHIVS